MTQKLTQKRLKELLAYDANSGEFLWKHREGSPRFNGAYAGKQAGCLDRKGYRLIRIDKVLYKAHRLAWLYTHGKWPEFDIDHINQDTSDNKLENLRHVSHQDNAKNQRLRNTNKSGVNGVREAQTEGRWVAEITVDGVNRHLGTFLSMTDAVLAREEANERYRYHGNHGAC